MEPYKDNREVFEIVKAHLLKQNKKCVEYTDGLNPVVRYKSSIMNCACSIGCLIPDSLYTQDIEGTNFLTLEGTNEDLRKLFENVSLDFLRRLLIIHDHYHPVHWKKKLDEVEELYLS